MAEAVKVIVRCRPMNQRERNLGCAEVVSMSTPVQCAIVNPDAPNDPPKDFTFDGAYFTDSTTEQIYNDVCFDLVENVLEGYNGTVFAYGQTGCGKSFSMQGIPNPATQRGIIPRAFDHIFEAVSIAKDKKFLVYASYLEIYNEQVRDLLSKDAKKQLDLKEHPEKGVYVHGLSMNEVRNVDECQLLMMKGWNNRSVGATLMNADSSRSHSIFTINIEIMGEGSEEQHFLASKLNLVDLAGSERQSKTGASGDRLKEATKINLSLSALGNVISALVDGKSKHIPYRDSKLTRLLQDSLGGNTKTLMVACLSPAADNYDETLSTLRYANRAKNIKNKPKINEDPKDALLRQYQEEIMQLKAMLEGKPIPVPQSRPLEGSGDRSELEREKDQMKKEYENHLRQMELQISELSRAKQMVEHELTTLRGSRKTSLVDSSGASQPVMDEMQRVEDANRPPDEEGDNELCVELSDDENEECRPKSAGSAGSFHKGDASAFKKSPELKRKNARPKSSAPNLIPISEADSESSPRAKNLQHAQAKSLDEAEIDKSCPENGTLDSPQIPQEKHALTKSDQEAAMKRLAELEAMFNNKFIKGGAQLGDKGSAPQKGGVGGGGSGLLEKRAKRKRQAEEKRRKALREAAESDNMDTVVQVYDNVMNEIQDREKVEEKLKRKIRAAEVEIRDLQSEFEDERRDYLETIRSQAKQMQLLEAILDKVQPLIQRDCNYFNLRKVKEEAKYDIDATCWRLPDVHLIKTNLPSLGTDGHKSPKGPTSNKYERPNGMTQSHVLRYEDTAKFIDENDDVFQNYMKPKRVQKILEEGAATRGFNDSSRFGSPQQDAFGSIRGSHPILDQSFSSPTAVGGVLSPTNAFEIPNPKNVRLEKLDLSAERPFSTKTRKKKKEKNLNV